MRLVLAFVPFFVLFGGVLFAQTQAQTEPPRQPPSLIKGEVVDQDGATVEGAVVRVLITTLDQSDQEWGKLLEQTLTTNGAGEFQLSLKKAPAKSVDLFLNLSVGSKIHFRSDFHFPNDKLWRKEVDLGSLKITKGVRVTGQLVSPDTGVDLLRPVVNFVAQTPAHSTFYHSDNCDEEGRFACVVPAGCKLKLSAAADNFAFSISEHEIKYPVDGSDAEIPEVDIGRLVLKRGVSVVGSAKLKDGCPASGVVIGIIEGDPGEGDGVLHVSSTKTDSKGHFKLPPHLGKCRLYALKACRNRSVVNGETETLKTDGKVPLINPVDIDLDGKGHELNVELKEAESLTVSGTVVDAKGAVLVGQPISYGWGSPKGDFGMEGAIEVNSVKTNSKGEYSFQFGKGRKLYMQLNDSDLSDADFDFFVTKKAAYVLGDLFPDGSSKRSWELKFKPIVQNVTGLNWEVRRRRGSSMLKRAGGMMDWLID